APRATEILARLNRLAAIDPNFGDPSESGNLAKRFAAVKKRALAAVRRDQTKSSGASPSDAVNESGRRPVEE
ncbi:MAG: hypothetical protein QM516_05850, partial [Limnohabitans sp.]|nr:hypothetical protein [Limnohabitans sp.]